MIQLSSHIHFMDIKKEHLRKAKAKDREKKL